MPGTWVAREPVFPSRNPHVEAKIADENMAVLHDLAYPCHGLAFGHPSSVGGNGTYCMGQVRERSWRQAATARSLRRVSTSKAT